MHFKPVSLALVTIGVIGLQGGTNSRWGLKMDIQTVRHPNPEHVLMGRGQCSEFQRLSNMLPKLQITITCQAVPSGYDFTSKHGYTWSQKWAQPAVHQEFKAYEYLGKW
jgi:hypothetical protein